jgi:O-methyltransferase
VPPVRNFIQGLLAHTGYQLTRLIPRDFTPAEAALVRRVCPYTLTSPESVLGAVRAVEHVVTNGIDGDIVECGVWRGGSMMAMALTLLRLGAGERELDLFDTFDGMTAPTKEDVDYLGVDATSQLARDAGRTKSISAYAPLEVAQQALASTGYDMGHVHFVRGRVEDTLPAHAPATVSVLRLDTDWYQSTRHELEHLYPRLAWGGILIVDDYGHWKGSRQAVDEYIAQHHLPIFLHRLDWSGRIAVKI